MTKRAESLPAYIPAFIEVEHGISKRVAGRTLAELRRSLGLNQDFKRRRRDIQRSTRRSTGKPADEE
jgi:hypothetical protein